MSPTSTETDPIEDLPLSVEDEDTQEIRKPTLNVRSGAQQARTRKESVSLPVPESSHDSDFVADDDDVVCEDKGEDSRINRPDMSASTDDDPVEVDARSTHRSVPETPEPDVIDSEPSELLPREKAQSESVRKRSLQPEHEQDSSRGSCLLYTSPSPRDA